MPVGTVCVTGSPHTTLFKGKVVSKKMHKTITVLFERTFIDSKVKKIVTKRKKFHVHDPLEQAKIGDEVSFYEGPHISKIKYMHLYSIIKNNNLKEVI